MLSILETKIKECSQKYYDGESIISDKEFDDLIDQLRIENPQSEILTKIGWGYNANGNSGNKVAHRYGSLIGSLEKAREISEVRDSVLHANSVMFSAKLDGLSCVNSYIEGDLDLALTRGDGTIGIDITDKIRVITKNSKVMLDDNKGFTGSLRGEILISKKNWEQLLKDYPCEVFKNSRNTASGIMNRSGVNEKLKYVSFVPYNVIASNVEFISLVHVHSFLKWNFGTIVDHDLVSFTPNKEYITSYYNYLVENCEWQIDGIVISNCKLTYQEIDSSDDVQLVVHDQQAFKFKSEVKITRVESVEWSLSKSNKLIPVVLLDPIELSGATISRVSGFNAKYINENKIGTGAEVEVERSGEIIPDIQEVTKPADNFELPTECPVCLEPLSWEGVNLVCANPNCSNINMKDLIIWSEILGKVDGLGEKIKLKSFGDNSLAAVQELYFFGKDSIVGLDDTATGKKLKAFYDKMFDAPVDAEDVLVALNIPRLGRSSAKKIIASGIKIDELMASKDLLNIVGEATYKSILANADKLERIKHVEDRLVYPEEAVDTSNLLRIAITGKLVILSRKDLEKLALDHGYLSGSINKDTKYLVTNDPTGSSSKNKRADELGIEKITEKDFINLLNSLEGTWKIK